jgi:hypothetical protein
VRQRHDWGINADSMISGKYWTLSAFRQTLHDPRPRLVLGADDFLNEIIDTFRSKQSLQTFAFGCEFFVSYYARRSRGTSLR